jgi:mono/diheme cytochrome c family protein
MKNITRLLIISFGAILLVRCQPFRQTADTSPDQGAKLFIDNCSRCHLSTGAGGPAPGSDVNGSVSAPDIRRLTKTPAELQQIITYGFGKMPSFKDSISDENISQIASYVAAQIEVHPSRAN